MNKTIIKKICVTALTLGIIAGSAWMLKSNIVLAMQNEEDEVVSDVLTEQEPLVIPEMIEEATAGENAQNDNLGNTDIDAISLDNCIITCSWQSDKIKPENLISRDTAIKIAINKVNDLQKSFGEKLENQTLWIDYFDGTDIIAEAGENQNIRYPNWLLNVKVLYNIDAKDYKNISGSREVLDRIDLSSSSMDYTVEINALTGEIIYISKRGISEMDKAIIDNADNRPGVKYREMAEQEAREFAQRLFPDLTINSVKLVWEEKAECYDAFQYQVSMSDGSDLICEFNEWYRIKPHDKNNYYPPKNENAAFYDEGAVYVMYFPKGVVKNYIGH